MLVSTKKRVKESEMNMTPMIDVVFLLITFFMVVTEITRQDDIEDLQLPDVVASTPDDNPDPQRLVLNVKRDGSFWFGGARRTEQQVKDALAIEARLSRNADGISDRVVLVKADRRVRFEAIRKLIILCVDRNIRIWRLAFGTLPRKSSGPVAE